MSNRLAHESSPYLLQHQNNPVDWFPWGDEALARAKAEDKPVFLSIGYSACHWCHVMEHESFESDDIAAVLNANFVSIKVDREERPDLDQIYMNAVQMLTGRGGWPMSVFLTPAGQPFFGGTYWPPTARMGMPGFVDVLNAVSDAWKNKREQLFSQAQLITEKIRESETAGGADEHLTEEMLLASAGKLQQAFDSTHGGFGTAPKFPHPMDLGLLLRLWKRTGRAHLLDMVRLTLDKMAAGGIYDHLGGGFARYSVDEKWLVPHFEKMLYDNSLLAAAYIEGYLATGDENYARVARETFDYILRDMTDEAGGFYSTEDADSEGEEGKFYVWSVEEIRQVLGDDRAEKFCYVYDVSTRGNFEGHNILNLPKSIEQCAKLKAWPLDELRTQLAEDRAKLFEVREKRIHPGKDDKIIVAWNGLMIDAMARGAGALRGAGFQPVNSGDLSHTSKSEAYPTYLAAACRAADFILSKMTRDDGRLLHTYRHGQAKLDAYLDDYAAMTNALVTLYEETFDERWIREAVRLAEIMLAQFKDADGDGFFYTAADHEQLIARQKDVQDSSVPSGNSLAATGLLRLGKLTGRSDFTAATISSLRLGAGLMHQFPTAAGQMLIALDFHLGPTPEIVILGDPAAPETAAVLADLRSRFLPNRVIAGRSGSNDATDDSPLTAIFVGKQAGEVEPTLYICENFTCQAPALGPQAAKAAIARLR